MSDPFGSDVGGSFDEISDELERIRDLGDAVGNTLTSALRGAILEGQSLRGVLGDIGAAFAEIALKAALAPVGELISGAVGSLFSAFNPALGGTSMVAPGGGLAAPAGLPGPGQWGGSVNGLGNLTQGAAPQPGVNVNFNVTANNAQSFMSSEAEVSAMLLRTVRRGTRGT